MNSPYSSHSSPYHKVKIFIVAGFALIAYMLYSLTVEMYKNYQIDRHIENFEKKNEELISENQQKMSDYQYYTSDAYIEKIAKQSLGLINQGEEVIILPNLDTDATSSLDDQSSFSSEDKNVSNFVLWFRFFFKADSR